MAQRDILINSTNLLNTLRGPAKILYATFNATMPTGLNAVLSPTTGVPVTPWVAFGLTRGGINVNKNLDMSVRDDIDQITGAYDQDITDINYIVSTQLAEVLDPVQIGAAFDMGTPTYAAGTPTQMSVTLDDGNLKTAERRWAIIFPKENVGELIGFVFRRGAVTGGEKAFRFDKADPASPPLEVRMFPEISTSIPAADSYGRMYMIG
jgi:hypothetical protein